jgi:hypothetical protein
LDLTGVLLSRWVAKLDRILFGDGLLFKVCREFLTLPEQ